MQFEEGSSTTHNDYANDQKYPVKLAAAKLGVSAQTIYRLVSSGKLGCYWIGNSIRIGRTHLNFYLTRNANHADLGSEQSRA